MNTIVCGKVVGADWTGNNDPYHDASRSDERLMETFDDACDLAGDRYGKPANKMNQLEMV